MRILAIETSCDETACAVIEGVSPTLPIKVLANVVASSEKMHVKTGGIVPEVAAREQMLSIIPVVKAAMENGKWRMENVDAIAVTVGPGLVGSLLVGVETAKALAYAWEKPLVPVNHLTAHLYANWVGKNEEILRLSGSSHLARSAQDDKLALKSLASLSNTNDEVPEFPAVGLVVSGGHTDLVLMKSNDKIEFLGGTRDDAAGECLDKCARLLGLSYPGGPAIAAEAEKVTKLLSYRVTKISRYQDIQLPRPLIHEETWDFSFSGLKTALGRQVVQVEQVEQVVQEFAYEVQEAVVGVLVSKLERAVKEFHPKSLLLGGGVSANKRLREVLVTKLLSYSGTKLFIPPAKLCTDNAVMIGAAGFYHYSPIAWQQVQVEPGLEIG